MSRTPCFRERGPYETPATNNQKQKLWDLGCRDQSLIDGLGKKQASDAIQDLLNRNAHKVEVVKGVWGIIFGLSVCLFCVWLEGLSEGKGLLSFLATIAGLYAFCGLLKATWNSSRL